MDATPVVPRKQPLYFINAYLDFALVGGLSILAFGVVYFLYGSHDPRLDPSVRTASDPIVLLGQRLLWICNWPHFAATSYRLYHSRDNIRQYPLTALVIPWLILAGVFASVIYPDTIAPIFILSFLLWSPYHFSGQTVGVSLIYARRAGFFVGKIERLALSTFVFGTYLFTTIDAHTAGKTMTPYFEIPVYSLGLPAWMTVLAETTMYLAGIVLLLYVLRWCIQNKRILPPIVLLPAVAQFIWFVGARQWPTFFEFVPFFHSMQYLLIAWSMQLKEKMDLTHIQPSRRYVISETLRWWGLNVIYGACLFWLFPKVLTDVWHVKEALALGVTAAAVQIHHFFVDGVIWKLKRKTVSSPLMVNIDELLHPAPIGMPALAGVGAMALPAMEQKV